MKLFDINTAIGHWPFRKLKNNCISALRKELEAHEISSAAVANTNGIFYLDCHDANIELYEALQSHSDFVVGIATINPGYARWDADLTEAVKKFQFRGVRIVPQYHNFELNSPEGNELAELAASLDIPIFVPFRLIDTRQWHWLDTEQTIGFDQVYEFCRENPKTNVIYTESLIHAGFFDGKEICPNLFIEISRMRSSYGQQLRKLASAVGHKQLVFGSGSPFKEISPVILKLEHADLAEDARSAIAGSNATTLLKAK